MTRLTLRHSVGRWAVLAYLALGVLNVSTFRDDAVEEWLWAMSSVSSILIIYLPVCISFAAAESVVLHRTGASSLMRGPGMRRLLPYVVRVAAHATYAVGAYLFSAIAAYLLVFAEVGKVGPPHLELVPPALAGIVASIAMGVTLGHVVPKLVTPVLVAFGAYGAVVSQLLPVDLVVVGGATGSVEGMRYVPRVITWVTVFLACLAVLAAAVWVRRWWAFVPAAAAGAVAAYAAAVVLSFHGAVMEVDPHGSPPLCTGSAPEICVRHDRPQDLAEADALIRPAVSRLLAVEPRAAWQTVLVDTVDPRGRPGVSVASPRSSVLPASDLVARSLVSSALCHDDPQDRDLALLADYVAGHNVPGTERSMRESSPRAQAGARELGMATLPPIPGSGLGGSGHFASVRRPLGSRTSASRCWAPAGRAAVDADGLSTRCSLSRVYAASRPGA